jgi:hypothetical protein
MASSLEEIANLALGRVGNQPIVSLGDNNVPATTCRNNIYKSCRVAIMSGPWHCARQQVALAQLTAAPVYGWTYAYQLPNDYLRMVEFNNLNVWYCNDRRDYDLQGKMLLTDAITVNITYIKDLTMAPNDLSQMSADLDDLCAIRLAMDIAWPLQQTTSLRQQLYAEFNQRRREAMARDSLSTRQPLGDYGRDSVWLQDRYVGPQG